MEEDSRIQMSVIIPVYGVEQYVERCVRSLMKQTLMDRIEFIFVDDCTPDQSMRIIEKVAGEYPERGNQIKILHHDRNLGLPAARNTGMSVACGEYVFHCDSDDFLETDMLECMLDEAIRTDADMVWCDWYLSFGENEREMKQPESVTPRKAVSDMLGGCLKYNVWNKIVRRKVYEENNVAFPSGYTMGEDMTMIRLASKANKVGYVARPMYHYGRVNSDAISQAYDVKKISELRHNVDITIKYVEDCFSDDELSHEIDWFKLNAKLPFLFTGNKTDFEQWRSMYPESDRSIMSNKSQPLRTRLIQWCASHKLDLILTLYYRFVYRFVYGVVFK